MTNGIYDLNFWDKMLRQNSSSAEHICRVRWEFVLDSSLTLPIPVKVLDYGSGVGFFRAFRPPNVEVDTYDVGQYPQTGICHERYDIMTMWDVLEHLPNLKEIEPYLCLTKHVVISLPIKPPDKPLNEWKHFKPREHLHYYTPELLNAVFKEYGFKKVKCGTPECPPREDILDVMYRRI